MILNIEKVAYMNRAIVDNLYELKKYLVYLKIISALVCLTSTRYLKLVIHFT
jgi:hypothetical protein